MDWDVVAEILGDLSHYRGSSVRDRPMRRCFMMILCFSFVGALAGCGKSKEAAETEPDLPEWLAEDEDAAASDRRNDAEFFGDDEQSAEDWNDSDDGRTADRAVDSERLGKLELRLQEGDRFPLRKVIDVELAQASMNGPPEISRRRLEMMMMITVGEQADERTKLQVAYDRVLYTRDIGGDHLEYDSRQPPQEIPVAVRMYHDMVRDGFSFWVDDKNHIVESEDFKAFIGRCLQNIPEDQRQQVLYEVESTGENGITDFIDNSIGLLPYGYHKAGDAWERTRNIGRPIPMVVKNTYTLTNLSADTAVISVNGIIGPSSAVQQAGASSDLQVNVTGGSSEGSCIVFRDTGLPQKSHVETVVDMMVTAGPVQFTQEQKTVTTIESYPAVHNSEPRVMTAEHEFAASDEPPAARPVRGRKVRRLK
jgi:hypothetical protein